MSNASDLIHAAFNMADSRYRKQDMIEAMLEIIEGSSDVTTEHEKKIRALALELTDLVEPE